MNPRTDLNHFNSLSATCKALSHPARLAILQILALRGTCICGEIVEVMPLSQATVSQHLKILKNANLISGEIDGQRSCYCINGAALSDLREKFGQLFGLMETCC